MRKPTVVVADDHAIVKEGLIGLLKEQGFDVVGAVGDGQALLEVANRLRPDIIVTDLSMPGLSGLEVLTRLQKDRIPSHVIVLTMNDDAELAAQAMRAGARGFVLKHSAGEELIAALHHVIQGHVYLTPALTREVMEQLAAPGLGARSRLTPRQLDVLRLLLAGKRMKEVAAALQLSTRTVETHKYDLMDALGVTSTAELVRYAIEHRLLPD